MRLAWLKDEDGEFSLTAICSVAAVFVVLLRVLIGGISVTIDGHTVQVSAMDASLATGVLAATLGAYVARRHTAAKYPSTPDEGTTINQKTETTVVKKEPSE